MRVLFFGNNWVGWKIAEWLHESEDQIVGLVMHPESKRKFGGELRQTVNLSEDVVFDGSELSNPGVLNRIRQLKVDIGVSAFFGYRLRHETLSLLPKGCVNLHPSMLPYNRGAHPNVWSIVDETPCGVTMHYMDDDFDTGPIISQDCIPIEPTDTGAGLYRRLEVACVNLFIKTWPRVRTGMVERLPNDRAAGSFHRVRDFETVAEIDLFRTYTARELINILRATTFPPFPGAYFWEDGRKVYLQLKLSYEPR